MASLLFNPYRGTYKNDRITALLQYIVDAYAFGANINERRLWL